jgi:hypothetical protein
LQAACAILSSACGGDDPEPARGIPCDVQAVLDAKCRRCHGAVLQNEAPYHFMTIDQIHEVRGGRPVYDRMRTVLEDDFMPPVFAAFDPPVEPLTAAEKATLLQWVTAGAPADPNPQCR